MTNQRIDDQAPPPPMSQGELSFAELKVLLRAIADHAVVEEVLLKRGATRMIDAAERATLESIPPLLQSGEIRGAQVRYAWEGATWMDTILAAPAGCRVVRIRHD
jgi:hypothetical protein